MLTVGSRKLIPAPLLNISKAVAFVGDGRPLSSTYKITMQGTLLPHRGSPRAVDGWWVSEGEPPDETYSTSDEKFNALNRKQEMLRAAFSVPGTKISYAAAESPPVVFYGKLVSLNFEPDVLVIKSKYTAEFDAASLQIQDFENLEDSQPFLDSSASGRFLSSASDSWQIRERDDGSNLLEVQRTVAAVGFTAYTTGNTSNSITGLILGGEAYLNAKAWVETRLLIPLNTGNTAFTQITGALYNLIEEETVDKYAGSYSRTQRYLYHNNNYVETRSVSKTDEYNLLGDGAPLYTQRISVNGTIQGMDPDNNVTNKLSNAIAYFSGIASGLYLSVDAPSGHISQNVTQDLTNGSISYSMDFVKATGSSYKHSYDVTFSMGSESPSVTIAGNIEGITPNARYIGPSGNTKFNYAASGWDLIKPNLKSLAFAESTIFGGASYEANFPDLPTSKSIAFNKANGTVNYNFTYGFAGLGGSSNDYRHEYTIDISTNNAKNSIHGGQLISATINGTILGFPDSSTPDDPTSKFTNAKTAWQSIKPGLFAIVSGQMGTMDAVPYAPPILSGFVSRSTSLNPQAGIVSYSATFNNAKPYADPNAAVVDVIVNDIRPRDVAVTFLIPGRTIGPIIQNMGTQTENRKEISATVVLYPKGGGNYWDYSDIETPNTIASGAIDSILTSVGVRGTDWYLENHSTNFDFKNGVFTKNMTIIY